MAIGIAAVYGMILVRAGSEERSHLFEYGLVAVLIHEALSERFRLHPSILRPAIVAIAITALVGLLDESIQALIPNRGYQIADVGFNALAGFMAVAASLSLTWARRRGNKNMRTPTR